jgi:hypothetical protein
VSAGVYDCQACGACCAYSPEWPRLTLEDDADIARIPAAFLDDGAGFMRWAGCRCAALTGEVGRATACAVYDARPIVCRDCQPGDVACLTARRANKVS